MEAWLPRVYMVQSPVFELLASLFRLQCHERLSRDGDGVAPLEDFDLGLWVQRVRSELSQDMQEALETFFNYESFMGLSMAKFSWETNSWSSVDGFLKMLGEAPPAVLFERFLNTGYTPEGSVETDDPEKVRDYINRTNLPDIEKWKFAYLYLNMETTKARFIELLAFCNRLYFAQEWDDLRRQQAESIDATQKSVHRPEDLLDVFPHLEGVPLEDPNATIVLAPSVFYHLDSLSSFDDEHHLYLSIYGVRYPGRPSMRGDEVIAFMKALADETRIKIIKILAMGPRFGYELAQQLKLSNSTISHHLSILAESGVVRPTREENRVSYALERQYLRGLMEAMAKQLLG